MKQEHALTKLDDPPVTFHEQVATPVADDASKSEEEINVDDSVKESPQSNAATSSGVVIIDDDSKSSPVEKSKQFARLNDTVVSEDAVDGSKAEKTQLEELISWLHDKTPLSTQQLSDLKVTMGDFEKALKSVQPSAKREGFATVPDVTWDDVGSLQDIREELKLSILVSSEKIICM